MEYQKKNVSLNEELDEELVKRKMRRNVKDLDMFFEEIRELKD
jgi:hypothetical protein